MTVYAPPWLSAEQAAALMRANPVQAAPKRPKVHSPKLSPVPTGAIGLTLPPEADSLGFEMPRPWDWDGGVRRAPVLDHDHFPPRIVRMVGWRVCLRCSVPYWSDDVVKLRLCHGCRGRE
jgi:hypothetical protein